MSHTPNTPVPSRDQYRQQLVVLDASLAGLPASETLTALRDIIAEQYRLDHGPATELNMGADEIFANALRNLTSSGAEIDRATRLTVAALLIASFELDAYEGRA